jgi:hypothetical protein
MTQSLIAALGLAYFIGYFVWAWSYDAERPWVFDKIGIVLYVILPLLAFVIGLVVLSIQR